MKYGSFKYGQYAYSDIVLMPFVTDVTITPNPANINQSFSIAVAVTEVAVIMYRVSKISGAAISGEGTNPAVKFEEVS